MAEVSAGLDDPSRHLVPALHLASPDLYDRNAFRILELSVEASEREITRRRELVEKSARGNFPIPAGPASIVPLRPPPDEYTARDAAQAILDAEHRLAHEFFWLWPLQTEPSKDPSTDEVASKHNLAVLFHCAALAAEKRLVDHKAQLRRTGVAPPGSTAPDKQLAERWLEPIAALEQSADAYWRAATENWRFVIESEQFWSRVTARIRALDDASLTTGAARRLRHTLPVVLTVINVRLCLRALEFGDERDAERNIARVRGSSLPSEAIEEAIQKSVEPIRSQLKTLCDATPADPAEAATADAVADHLLEQSKPALSYLDFVVRKSSVQAAYQILQAEGDQVASIAFSRIVDYGYKTKKWKRAQDLLCRLPTDVSTLVAERIGKYRTIIDENVEGEMCWFCGQNERNVNYTVRQQMYGNVQRYGGKVHWQYLTVNINKCAVCVKEEAADVRKNLVLGFMTIICVLGVIVLLLDWGKFMEGRQPVQLNEWAATVLIILGFLGLGGCLIAGYRRKRVADSAQAGSNPRPIRKRTISEYPQVQKLLREGWAFGGGPSR
jgi:hypothetical protein